MLGRDVDPTVGPRVPEGDDGGHQVLIRHTFERAPRKHVVEEHLEPVRVEVAG